MQCACSRFPSWPKESNRVSLFFAASAIQSAAAGPMLQQEFRQISGRSAKKRLSERERGEQHREDNKKDPGGAACTAQRDVIYLRQKRQIYQKWFCRGEWMRHTIIYYCGTAPLEFDGLWDGCQPLIPRLPFSYISHQRTGKLQIKIFMGLIRRTPSIRQ